MMSYSKKKNYKIILLHVIVLSIIWFVLPDVKLRGYALFGSPIVLIAITILYFFIFYLVKAHLSFRLQIIDKNVHHEGYISQFLVVLKELIHYETQQYKVLKGRGLYQKPWFLSLGSQASGKSALIRNCGQDFQSKHVESTGSDQTQPTLNWYSSDHVVFVEPNAKLTQSIKLDENNLWDDTLELITRVRPLKHFNGIILTISADILMNSNEQEFEREMQAQKLVLKKAYQAGIKNAPIYLFISHMDKIPGFLEFFDVKTLESLKGVWGVTLPTDGLQNPLEWLSNEYQQIIHNLNERLFSTMRKKHNKVAGEKIFYFARYFAYMGKRLNQYLSTVIYANSYSRSFPLRGYYFTAIRENELHHFDHEKVDCYFTREVFDAVILKECQKPSLLQKSLYYATHNQRLVFVGSSVTTVILITAWITGFVSSNTYLSKVRHDNQALQPLLAAKLPSDQYWNKLSRIQALSYLRENNYADWWHHLGFTFPSATAELLNQSYQQQLLVEFEPFVLSEIEHQILILIKEINDTNEITVVNQLQKRSDLYQWLMMYMMFDKTDYMDKKLLEQNMAKLWQQSYASEPEKVEQLQSYLTDMLALNSLRVSLNQNIITQAQQLLGGDAYVFRAYQAFKIQAEEHTKGQTLILGGANADQVFTNTIGINYAYTLNGWQNYAQSELAKQVELARNDQWVFGGSNKEATYLSVSEATQKIYQLYWHDYANIWWESVSELHFKSLDMNNDFDLTVARLSQITDAFAQVMDALRSNITTEAVSAGAADDQAQQQQIKALVAFVNNEGHIKQLIGNISTLNNVLSIMNRSASMRQQQSFELAKLIASKQQSSFNNLIVALDNTPSPLNTLLNDYLQNFTGGIFNFANTYLMDTWNTQMSGYCRDNLASYYPFSKSKEEMTLTNFERIMLSTNTLMSYVNGMVSPLAIAQKNTGELSSVTVDGIDFPFNRLFIQNMSLVNEINTLMMSKVNKSGEKVFGMALKVTPVLLSENLSGIEIIYNDEKVSYYNGPQYEQSLQWPAQNYDGTVQIKWSLPNGETRSYRYYGQWGLVRLLSSLTYDKSTDTYALSLDNYQAKFKIKSQNGGSISALSKLGNFTCQY